MPFVIDEISKFGRKVHRADVSDTFYATAGNHSRYVDQKHVTASPRYNPVSFVNGVVRIVHK